MKIVSVLALFMISIMSISGQTQKTPETTELWDPVPPVVTPGDAAKAPSDAIVLFNGTGLNEWTNEKGEPAGWITESGFFTVRPGAGSILTKRLFGDCQLHIEWRTPAEVKGEGQGRGNSGIFFMNLYELQVLDSYNNLTYSNGQAGSVYKQSIPLVNACKKPGEWQTYDVIFMAPRLNDKGRVVIPGRITVIQNGVLVQNNIEIRGTTEYIGSPRQVVHDQKAPISLQDHGNPVSYRNIWIREL